MKGMRKISRSNAFKEVLGYAFGGEMRRPSHGRLIVGNLASTGINSMVAEFWAIAGRRPDIAKPVWHSSLRMPLGEDVSDERWIAIAKSYLIRMGFDLKKTQFLVVKHPDQHIHLIVNRVFIDGTVFHGQNENFKSTRVIGEMEKAFCLTLTPGPSYDMDGKIVMPKKSGLKKAEREMMSRTGRTPARLVLQNRVAIAMQGVPTMAMFLQRLDEAGVISIPHIAEAGAVDGFSFGWQGVVFSGSQLGAAYKWAAIQKNIIYVDDADDADDPELARRQVETRTGGPTLLDASPEIGLVWPDTGSEKPDAGANAEFDSPDSRPRGLAPEPEKPDQRIATTNLAIVGADATVISDDPQPHVNLESADATEYEQENPVDQVGFTPKEGGGAGPTGLIRVSPDSFEGNTRAQDPLEQVQIGQTFEKASRLASRHDEALVIQAWRVQAKALDASVYRLILKDRLCPLGVERIDPIGECKHGQAAPAYTATQIEAMIPALRLSNQRGFDVYLTPVHLNTHYLLVHEIAPERMVAMQMQGYTPALILGSGDDERQAVIKVPRCIGRSDDQDVTNAIEADINLSFGGGGHLPAEKKLLPMAGFSSQKTSKKDLVIVVLDAIGQPCHKTFDRIAAQRRELDQVKDDERRALQMELEKSLLAEKLLQQFEIDAQMYLRYATGLQSQSQDPIDDAVALAMLQEDYLVNDVLAVLRTSPHLERRHLDVDLYLDDLIQHAQEAWANEVEKQEDRHGDISRA
ncbi:MAG: DNA-primase RepB domain-containing protein [Rhodoferax sp.]|uniref:relaxase/mobilization nuclease domain-containing protein n=1 Tax=Rhodoferax sp. TaxID=50421 RepID=UPI00262049E7|nr:DNA-primase RepB domain-containing protein [Rhodoferax sp.]MDD2881447.1 DNA-primase RepB domain-containing protein [Rhodoferax sp.]